MTSTLSKGALACAFTIGMLLLGQALAEDLFRGLPEGRVVEVTFTSQGCFHQSIHEFRFRRAGSLFVEVTKVSSPWEESEIKASNPTRVPLGTVVLSDVEAVSLDRLIAFYREGREGGCTTVDSIKISQIENGKPVTTESFTDATCATDHLQGTMIFYDVIVKCSPIPKPVRVPRPDPELEHQREQANALAVCDKRPDFERLGTSFEVKKALLGFVNSMPESLYVQLKATGPTTIDAARWWNPIANGAPSLSWDHFISAHAIAESMVARHPWLVQRKRLPGERSLELQLLGTEIGWDSSELSTYVLPVWRNAGMAGRPAYLFLARRGQHSWVEFIFSDEDNRALVPAATVHDADPRCALDRL